MLRKPLVLDSSAQTQQLQSVDDLEIPLNEKVAILEAQFQLLLITLNEAGIELPDQLLIEMEKYDTRSNRR
jgi:hypothetical protein